MKIQDVKIGMRIGFCRAQCAKQGWSKHWIDYFIKEYSLGRIVAFYDHYDKTRRRIVVMSPNSPTKNTCDFAPDVLVPDE